MKNLIYICILCLSINSYKIILSILLGIIIVMIVVSQILNVSSTKHTHVCHVCTLKIRFFFKSIYYDHDFINEDSVYDTHCFSFYDLEKCIN